MRRWVAAIVLGGACAAWPRASAGRGTSLDLQIGARRGARAVLRLEPLVLFPRRPFAGALLAPPRAWSLVAPPSTLWSLAPAPRDERSRAPRAWRPPSGTIFDALVQPRIDALAARDDVAPLPAGADWRMSCQLSLRLPP